MNPASLTRSGEPRLAIFGSKTSLHQPITFAAFDTQLTIMTNIDNPKLLSVFYRGDELQQPVSTVALPVLSTYRCTRSSQTFGRGAEKSATAGTVQIKSRYFFKSMRRKIGSIGQTGSQTKSPSRY